MRLKFEAALQAYCIRYPAPAVKVENVDSREYLAGLFNAMYDELPVHKANNKKKSLNNLYTFQ